ncbi:phage tail protein [Chloroflexota bacterium]
MKKLGIIIACAVVMVMIIVSTIMPASAAPKAGENDYSEYIGNYNYRLEIDGVDAGQFTSVDGLSIEQEVIEYQNGDDPLTRKRPGRVKYGDITLTREYTAGSILNDWIEASRYGNGDYTRKNISIVLIDNQGQELKRWNCFECFPESWKLSSLDGKGNDVLTEEIVIVIEWFEEA